MCGAACCIDAKFCHRRKTRIGCGLSKVLASMVAGTVPKSAVNRLKFKPVCSHRVVRYPRTHPQLGDARRSVRRQLASAAISPASNAGSWALPESWRHHREASLQAASICIYVRFLPEADIAVMTHEAVNVCGERSDKAFLMQASKPS